MIIETLHIVSFGSLASRTVELAAGINVIHGENEAGKSTLAMFIKFMLYGLSSKSTGEAISERERYVSWETGTASGSMTFSVDGARYRIERTLARGSGTFREELRLFDCESETAPPFAAAVTSPGEYFLGVPENVYMDTVFVRQMADTAPDGRTLGESIENILFSGDEAVNTQKAMEKLNLARRHLRHNRGSGGAINDLSRERDALTLMLEEAKQSASEIIALEGSLSDVSDMIAQDEGKVASLKVAEETIKTKRQMERLEALEARRIALAEAQAKHSTLLAAAERNGTVPDRARLGELRTALDELNTRSERILRLEEKLAGMASPTESAGMTKEATDAFIAELHRMKKSAKKCLIIGLVFLALTIAVAAVAFVLPMYILLLGCIPPLGVAVDRLICAVGQSITVRNTCRAYGAETVDDLPRALQAQLEAHAQAELDAQLRREVDFELLSERERLVSALEGALGQLRTLGIEAKSNNVRAKMAEAITLVERFCDDAAASKSEVESCEAALSAAEQLLGGVDEDELRARAAATDFSLVDGMDDATVSRQFSFYTSRLSANTQKKHEIEKRLSALYAVAKSPSAISAKLEEIDARLVTYQDCLSAYQLAHDTLAEASDGLRRSISPRIGKTAGKLIDRFTGGKYSTVGVDSNLAMTYSDGNTTHALAYLSAGTQDVSYLALRLALLDLLYRKTAPVLVFDETFARMDETRLSRVLELLSVIGGEGQCLILTCRARERDLLADKADVHLYELSAKEQK